MIDAWSPLVHDLTVQLVRAPSVTNTPDEQAFADHLHALLAAHPYFQVHPEQVWSEPALNDPQQRRNVWAFVRGTGSATVLLAGHYDVVNVDNYGPLAPWAYDPAELLPRLIAEIERAPASAADRLALDDLRSGEYLPGRGALDMKSGLAAGIAVLQRFAETDNRVGNLLFVATPDEEVTSQGMCAAALRLASVSRELQIELVAAINLDAIADRTDGSDGRAVCFGSAGKLLASVYLVGNETHAAYPFDGLNPNRLAAEVTRRFDSNVDLCDHAEGEWAPPPANLKQADTKQGYDVTTPTAAWCTYNVLCYGRGPSAVLELLRNEVQAALSDVVQQHQAQAARYATLTGHDVTPVGEPLMLTFADLRERALQQGGASAEHDLTNLTTQLVNDDAIDLPEYSRRITELVWRWSGLSGPAAVLGFAALYYPRVQVGHQEPAHARLREVVTRQVATVAKISGVSIRTRPFFPAISDMSFLGGDDTPDDLATMALNTPPWGTRVHFDFQSAQALNLPTINIGPWGRDYHQRTERVHMPYSFGVLPELIWHVVQDLLVSS